MFAPLRARAVAGAALAVLVSGCEPDDPMGGGGRRPLQGRILFTVQDVYAPPYSATAVGAPRVGMRMRTEHEYPCMNYVIEARVTRSQAGVFFDLLGAGIGPICLTALGPAHRADILDFEPGTYEILFQKQDSLDAHRVTVTDSSLLVAPLAARFSIAAHDTVWRVPRSSMAVQCETRAGAESLCTQLVTALQAAVSLREFQFPETGLAPYGRTREVYGSWITVRQFRYEAPDSFARAAAAVQAWLDAHRPGGLFVMLTNWDNTRAFPH